MKIQELDNTDTGYRPDKQEIIEWLHTQTLGVIATLDETGQPQGATVAFSETEDCELIIGTSETSRKAANIARDGRLSFTVTSPEQRYTVQLEGIARKLSDAEFEPYAERHYAKLPASAPFRNVKEQCHILITPTWIRFSDCNPYQWVLTEYQVED
ncbi:MAG: pyridoxamine 5'-phosphate oxidase family protein [Candidatus Saccharimonadales bacterium]